MISKAILIATLFSILFFYLGPTMFQGGDYTYHLKKSQNGCKDPFFGDNNRCETYAPLFHLLAKPFSYHENAFFYMTILIFGMFFPLIIYFYTKNWFSVLLYFTASNYVWYFMDGIFPQGLANIFLFILLYTKRSVIELASLVLLILSHGSGFIAGLIIYLFKHLNLGGWFCSSLFLNNKPAALYETIGTSGGSNIGVNDVLHYLVKTFPFPFLSFAFWESYHYNKRFFFLLITLIILGFFYSPRVWYVSFILSIPLITNYYSRLNFHHRVALVLVSIIVGAIQLFLFWNFKINCVSVF